MSSTRSTCREIRIVLNILVKRKLKGIYHLGDIEVDGKMLLFLVFCLDSLSGMC